MNNSSDFYKQLAIFLGLITAGAISASGQEVTKVEKGALNEKEEKNQQEDTKIKNPYELTYKQRIVYLKRMLRVSKDNLVQVKGSHSKNENQLNISKKIGKGIIGGTVKSGKKGESYNIRASYGNTSAQFNKSSKNYSAMLQQKILGQNFSLIHYGANNKTQFRGNIKPGKYVAFAFSIDNILDPNQFFLQTKIDGKYIDAIVRVDNLLEPKNLLLQTNVNYKNIEAFLKFCNLIGQGKTFVGATYSIGNLKFLINVCKYNQSTSYDIGLASKIFSVMYGKNFLGSDQLKLNIHFKI